MPVKLHMQLSFHPNVSDRILGDVRLQMSVVKQDTISTGNQTIPPSWEHSPSLTLIPCTVLCVMKWHKLQEQVYDSPYKTVRVYH
jgi:hypothetical protein